MNADREEMKNLYIEKKNAMVTRGKTCETGEGKPPKKEGAVVSGNGRIH